MTRGQEIDIPRLERTSFHSPRPYWGVLGDVDVDGDLDLVAVLSTAAGSRLYRNQGDGIFLPGENVIAGETWLGVLFGMDVNGDQAVDLVAPNSGRLLLNDGNGSFSTRPFWRPTSRAFAGGADLDDDGVLDIVTSNRSVLNLYHGRGNGTFAAPVELPLNAGRSTFMLTLGDFDDDGLVDICVATGNSQLLVFRNQDHLEFSPPETYPVGGFVVSGDFDGDGDLDLAVSGDRAVTVLWNLDDGTFAPTDSINLVHKSFFLAPVDLDQDGLLDLVTANPAGDSISRRRRNLWCRTRRI